MISAKEANEKTVKERIYQFEKKINESIERGLFSVNLRYNDWEKNWRPFVENLVKENGYQIIEEPDGWIYICWGD
jgi:hypothetical protein